MCPSTGLIRFGMRLQARRQRHACSAIAQTAHHHPRAGQEYSRSIRSADVNPISRSRVLLTRLGESLGD